MTDSLDNLVSAWLDRLSSKARKAAVEYHGLGCQPRSMTAIADELGLSRMRVHQIVGRGHRILKRLAGGRPLATHTNGIGRFLADRGGLASEDEVRRELARYVSIGDLDPIAACRLVASTDDRVKWYRAGKLLGDTSKPLAKARAIRASVRDSVPDAREPFSLNQALFFFSTSRAYHEECGEPEEAFVLACLRTDPRVRIRDGTICWVPRKGAK